MAGPGRLLAVTGGHRYDQDAFATLLRTIRDQLGWTCDHVEHPDVRATLVPALAEEYGAVLLHDLPGLRLARGAEPEPVAPSDAQRLAIAELLDHGIGVVALHHALAGWPSWDAWATVLGGRFLYAPGEVRGRPTPASGYRMADYRVTPFGEHPVCVGVEPFDVTDELYLCSVFEREIVPILATDADVTPAVMIDTHREVTSGDQVEAPHQPGSPFLGWVHAAGRSPVVYLLPGHTASTLTHPMYQRLVTNALTWVTTPAAHAWAASVAQPVDPRA